MNTIRAINVAVEHGIGGIEIVSSGDTTQLYWGEPAYTHGNSFGASGRLILQSHSTGEMVEQIVDEWLDYRILFTPMSSSHGNKVGDVNNVRIIVDRKTLA